MWESFEWSLRRARFDFLRLYRGFPGSRKLVSVQPKQRAGTRLAGFSVLFWQPRLQLQFGISSRRSFQTILSAGLKLSHCKECALAFPSRILIPFDCF